jgi:predicted XRE-type DNA-binding protein
MVNVIKSRGNVFADIGLPDAETHLLKAELVRRIGLLIRTAKLTQSEAAACMAMAQPDVPKMLKGQFRAIPLDKLLRCLVALGQDVTIGIQPPKRGVPASVTVLTEKRR